MRALNISLFFLLLFACRITAQDWKLIDPKYPTPEAVVATYDVTDYGAIGDGEFDNTNVFKNMLTRLRQLGGGVLFIPEGNYVIKGALTIPKSVTIRGEWKKPTRGNKIEGTVLMAYVGREVEDGNPFLTLESSAGVYDLNIWYPEQDPENIVPYSPTILIGRTDLWGNDYVNVRNVTLVNTYTGIIVSKVNGGGCPVIYDIYGTPLSVGIEIDNLADVGRIDQVDFSSEYWIGSGLPGSPGEDSKLNDWLYSNGTGIVMRRNDWSYSCNVVVEGYKIGFHGIASNVVGSEGAAPNGHNYNMKFINCQTGVQCDNVDEVGIMFTNIEMINCEKGFSVGTVKSGAVIQLYDLKIDSPTGDAFTIASGTKGTVLMQQSTIKSGRVKLDGGTLSCSDSDFENAAPQIVAGQNARVNLTGNRFKEEFEIDNKSEHDCNISHEAVDNKQLPEAPEFVIRDMRQKPDRLALYIVTDSEFGAKGNGKDDCTEAVQKALDKAAKEGGGVVFLPPGNYKFLGNLYIPSGVELKGVIDNSTTPNTNKASVLEVYNNKGNEEGEPFLKMEERSGLRGVVINYPEQVSSLMPRMPAYPYSIQVAGKDVYIVNVGLRAVYHGIDLFTYKCDNHFIDYLAGHAFKTIMRVGGNSENGVISNSQFNLIAYAYGHQSKFGSWPNSLVADTDRVYEYGKNNLEFIILGDCKNEYLYNNFIYGCQVGTKFVDDGNGGPSGIALGHGIDGARRALVYEKLGEDGFDMINSQIVAIETPSTRYIETAADFEDQVTYFNSAYWGGPLQGLLINNGKLDFKVANFMHPGENQLASVYEGELKLVNSFVKKKVNLVRAGHDERLFVQGSIVDAVGIKEDDCLLWEDNLPTIWGENIVAIEEEYEYAGSSWYYDNSHLYLNSYDAGTKVRFYEMTGRLIAVEPAGDIVPFALAPGMYIVNYQYNGKLIATKIVVSQ